MSDDTFSRFETLIRRMNEDNAAARSELLDSVYELICELVGERLGRKFEPMRKKGHEDNSVASKVWLRLHTTFKNVKINDVEHLRRLIAQNVDWAMKDIFRDEQRWNKQREGNQPADTSSASNFDPADHSSRDPGRLAERTEIVEILRNLMKELPEEQRVAFDQHGIQKKTYLEVATRLGVSERTAKYHYHLAEGWILERLDEMGLL